MLDEEEVANEMFAKFNKAKPLSPRQQKKKRVKQTIDLVNEGAMHEMVEEHAKEQNVVIDLTAKKNLLFIDTADGNQVVALGADST